MASIETHLIPKLTETKKTLEEYLQREERALHKHQFSLALAKTLTCFIFWLKPNYYIYLNSTG